MFYMDRSNIFGIQMVTRWISRNSIKIRMLSSKEQLDLHYRYIFALKEQRWNCIKWVSFTQWSTYLCISIYAIYFLWNYTQTEILVWYFVCQWESKIFRTNRMEKNSWKLLISDLSIKYPFELRWRIHSFTNM